MEEVPALLAIRSYIMVAHLMEIRLGELRVLSLTPVHLVLDLEIQLLMMLLKLQKSILEAIVLQTDSQIEGSLHRTHFSNIQMVICRKKEVKYTRATQLIHKSTVNSSEPEEIKIPELLLPMHMRVVCK